MKINLLLDWIGFFSGLVLLTTEFYDYKVNKKNKVNYIVLFSAIAIIVGTAESLLNRYI